LIIGGNDDEDVDNHMQITFFIRKYFSTHLPYFIKQCAYKYSAYVLR